MISMNISRKRRRHMRRQWWLMVTEGFSASPPRKTKWILGMPRNKSASDSGLNHEDLLEAVRKLTFA